METALIVYTQGTETPYVMDLYLNETISLQYSFTDIKDLKAKATYSRTFRIPATDNNSKIFGFIENNTFQFSSFNPKRKLNAIITVDTLPVMEGNIQWKASYTQQGKISEYEIVFFGNVIDFFKNIVDADFKNYIGVELNNDYNFIVNYLGALDILNGTIGGGNVDLALTDRGDSWVGNVSVTEGTSIYTTTKANIIKAGNLTPMVKTKYIFDKIMSLSGFELNSGDSATLINELNELYIPFTSEENGFQQIGNTQAAQFVLENGIDGITFDGSDFTSLLLPSGNTIYYYEIPNLTEVTDPLNYVVNNLFTAPFSGRYKIKTNINIEQNADGIGGCQLAFLIQDTNGDYRLSPIQTSGTLFINWTSGTSFPQYQSINCGIGADWDSDVYLNAGETVRPILFDINPNPINVTLTLRDASSQTTYPNDLPSTFFCDYVSKPILGNAVDWVANAPVMKCTEFMSAIFKMFNLVVIPDKFNSKLLSFIPLNEFLQSGDFKDWSNKIDISKDIVLTPTTDYQAQINTWTYKKSEDYLNNLYNTQGNRVYGRLELIDAENDFAVENQQIEVEFGSTPLALIPNTNYPIAKFVNDKNEYTNPTPRILYRTSDTMTIHILDDDTNTIDTNFVLPMFSHYQNVTPTISSNDYNFGQETPLHRVTSIPYKTLYQRYWNDYIENIYAPDARIMEAFFALEFADVYNFRYNDKIFIKDSYWRILEIKDYVVGMQESVQVKLIKIVSTSAPCNLTIDSITNTFYVLFMDAEGELTGGNQTCCEFYGYNWNEEQGKCYPVRQDGGGRKSTTSDIKELVKDVNVDTSKLLQIPNNLVFPTNSRSIVGGTNNNLNDNNDNSLIVGENNYVAPDLGAVTVVGSNANVINKGMTIGGNGSYRGEIQSGIVHLYGIGNFTNNTTYIDLLIEGATSYNIPTNTIWVLKVLLSGMQNTGADGTITGEYNLHIINRSTTVLFINATTIDETFNNFTGYLVWDVVISGETFYPRVKLVGSSTYPENNIKLTALTTFTQYHYE